MAGHCRRRVAWCLAEIRDCNFIAFDARSGKDLWHVQLGAAVYSTAITYQIDGKQYVAIPVGATLFCRCPLTLSQKKTATKGNSLYSE